MEDEERGTQRLVTPTEYINLYLVSLNLLCATAALIKYSLIICLVICIMIVDL
jgi:hypothetical protein